MILGRLTRLSLNPKAFYAISCSRKASIQITIRKLNRLNEGTELEKAN